jgi:hypothetical protein
MQKVLYQAEGSETYTGCNNSAAIVLEQTTLHPDAVTDWQQVFAATGCPVIFIDSFIAETICEGAPYLIRRSE